MILKFWIGTALIAVSFGLAFLGAMGAEATEHNYRRSRGVVAVLTGFVTDYKRGDFVPRHSR